MWISEDKWKISALAIGGVTSAIMAAQYFSILPSLSRDSNQSLNSTSVMRDYVKENGIRQIQGQKDIIAETQERFPTDAKMIASPDVAALLASLIKIGNCKKGIEVGTFTGYTTLTMALAMPKDDSKIITLDINDAYVSVGRKYWRINGVDSIIDLRIGPAVISLDNLLIDNTNLENFDFVFIDADKINYDAYYERVLKLIKKGGWILIDNVFQNGYVAQTTVPDNRQKDVAAIRSLNQKLKTDTRVTVSMIEIGDGVTLVVKN